MCIILLTLVGGNKLHSEFYYCLRFNTFIFILCGSILCPFTDMGRLDLLIKNTRILKRAVEHSLDIPLS